VTGTPGHYTEHSNYNLPIATKNKKDNTDLNESATKKNIDKKRVNLAETESEAVDDEREMKVTLDEEDDTITIKMGELKFLEELLSLSLQAVDISGIHMMCIQVPSVVMMNSSLSEEHFLLILLTYWINHT
jgi:hypothetical protein